MSDLHFKASMLNLSMKYTDSKTLGCIYIEQSRNRLNFKYWYPLCCQSNEQCHKIGLQIYRHDNC